MNAVPGNGILPPAVYVLVVDDELRLADNIVRYLLRHGYHARAVHSALAAHQAIAERAPDLALIDLNLPDAHGADLCRQIFQQLPGLPALLISAAPDANSIGTLRQSGVRGFLAKPFSLATLLGRIEDILTDGRTSSALDPVMPRR